MRNESIMSRVLKLTGAVAVGVLLYLYVLSFVLQTGWAGWAKVTGKADLCSWERIVRFEPDMERFAKIQDEARSSIEALPGIDRGLRRIAYHGKPFWIRHDSQPENSMAYLFAEHEWLIETNPSESVQPGDVVLDIGAHIGTFTAQALELGAAKVVAVEPDPGNMECLRRNFSADIAAGRVVLVEEAAWNKRETLTFHLGESSAWSSLMHDAGGGTLEVSARPLDEVVKELGLESVDYIKIDVEGAEAEVLEGAAEIFRAHRPTVMVDSHQGGTGWMRAPEILREAHPDYESVCGPCQLSEYERDHVVPHVMFYH
ncbi:MAG: FkbM family methyltransferase [Acidobacteria bacterium]|nr:FkbM family methyltransferase [Acidobacteriota bacterium]